MFRFFKLSMIGIISVFCFVAHTPQGNHFTFSSSSTAEKITSLDLPVRKNDAFKPGEILTYRLHYGLMDAAVATLEVKNEPKSYVNRECFHIVAKGESKGTFDFFFKVRDHYETVIDKSALVPWTFMRRVNEGGYTINQDYFFNQYGNKVNVNGNKTFEVAAGTQDMLSAFYAARTMDYSNAKVGDIFSMNCFIDNENWPLKIRYIGEETIDSDIGKIKCICFRPIVQKGRVFKKEEDLKVWISNDKNRIPVRAEAKVLIGSIKMDLMKVQNNASPLAIVK